MYRGFGQKKNTLFLQAERSHSKPRLVAGIEFPLLSTEIICQGASKPWVYSNFPSQPIHTHLRSLLIISKSQPPVKHLNAYFLIFFIFLKNPLFLGKLLPKSPSPIQKNLKKRPAALSFLAALRSKNAQKHLLYNIVPALRAHARTRESGKIGEQI